MRVRLNPIGQLLPSEFPFGDNEHCSDCFYLIGRQPISIDGQKQTDREESRSLVAIESINTRGGYAARSSGTFGLTGLNPRNQSRNEPAKVSFSTATRTARKGWTVQRFHRICWALAMRLAMISLIADSTQPVEMGSPSRWRSP